MRVYEGEMRKIFVEGTALSWCRFPTASTQESRKARLASMSRQHVISIPSRTRREIHLTISWYVRNPLIALSALTAQSFKTLRVI